MRTSVETITPSDATEMLKHNHSNRPVRGTYVKRLASAMRRGEWCVSHQGIAFSTDGTLLDGQHRLMAVVDSGVTCQMMVSRDVHPDAFRVMDQGARRSIADIGRLDRRVADTVNLAAAIITGPAPTFDQVEPVLKSRVGVLSAELIAHCGKTSRFFSSAPLKLACVAMSLRSDADKQFAFGIYSALAHLDYDAMTTPAKNLVRQEQRNKITAAGSNRADVIARGLVVFDRRKANISRVHVTDMSSADAMRIVRDAIRTEVAATMGEW